MSPLARIETWRRLILAGCLFVPIGATALEDTIPEPLTVPRGADANDPRQHYIKALLQLIVDNQPNGAPTPAVRRLDSFTNQERDRLLLNNGRLDVMSMAANTERESQYLPIRIPVFKGMLGTRLCLVPRAAGERFAGLARRAQLGQTSPLKLFRDMGFTVGQGSTWSTVKVFRDNDIELVTANSFRGLFAMTAANRFDCFSRGIQEPWAELKRYHEFDLVVEPHIVMRYKLPTYLFVHPERQTLARYIETGFEQAIENGSFNALFQLFFGDLIERASLDERVIIELENQHLHPKTPVDRPEYWLDFQAAVTAPDTPDDDTSQL